MPNDFIDANPLIEVTDQNDEAVEVALLPTSGSESQMIGMTEEDIKQLEELNVRLFNIPKQVSFKEKEITFNLN